jgi:hypothetical protein
MADHRHWERYGMRSAIQAAVSIYVVAGLSATALAGQHFTWL